MNEKEIIRIAANIINNDSLMFAELLDKVNMPMVISILVNESDGYGTIAGNSKQICLLLRAIIKSAFAKNDVQVTKAILEEVNIEMDRILDIE